MTKLCGDSPRKARKGRGAVSNPNNRYDSRRREDFDDGWGTLDEPLPPLRTTVSVDAARTIINYNQSPDIPFDRSVNPYRGCEHGCIYCYARPSHAFLGLSPGLDFESRLFQKANAAELLTVELAKPAYRCRPIALGVNTDAWQPIERHLKVTRGILGVLDRCRHPVYTLSKSSLIERDADLLLRLAERNLASVAISVTTLDHGLARRLEPRACAPARRIETIRRLAESGIAIGVLVAPIIPALTDAELESILTSAREAGARWASYVMLRLPLEVGDLFQAWLEEHAPHKAAHVMSIIREMRGGRDNDSRFGRRMRGSGPYADLIERRFQLACKRYGLARRPDELDCTQFQTQTVGTQLALFT